MSVKKKLLEIEHNLKASEAMREHLCAIQSGVLEDLKYEGESFKIDNTWGSYYGSDELILFKVEHRMTYITLSTLKEIKEAIIKIEEKMNG